ncbi:cupin domain-containing protein [[Phormidium ambiguum] IAM M-71]|nr:cupin domain-containing protein [Phormidium ambiguum]
MTNINTISNMEPSPVLWQPKKIHRDLHIHASVLPTSLIWHQTNFTGILFGCFESDEEVQEHPVTMLTRFEPGGFFPLHGHPGGEEILVLEGNFQDETGVHPPGTYMLNPEGFNHHPFSNEGCLTFVKLRQHGGKTRQQVRTNIFELPWQTGTVAEIEVQPIYEQVGYPEKVWIERWQPGTKLSEVVETELKEIFVIQGTWSDDFGDYPTYSWLRYAPNCPYSPASKDGCLIYVKTYPADNTTRFIVGEDFRHPGETDV